MPHLVIIAPGEKKTFTGCALVRIVTPSVRTHWTLVPRYVQIKVNVLKDVKPFVQLIEQQSRSAAAPLLPNDVFEKWIDSVRGLICPPNRMRRLQAACTDNFCKHSVAFSGRMGRNVKRSSAALLVALFAIACASTKPVNMTEPRRVVGTENDVRIDAEVYTDILAANVTIPIKYDVTNNRQSAILIADLVPQAAYDAETQTVTVDIGAEIPGEQFLPRLVSIPSGGKKSFTTAAHVVIMHNPTATPFAPRPNALRIRVNFLGETKPFEKLIDIPERAVHDPALAQAIFPVWVEKNETVVTNALPMHWRVIGTDESPADTGRRRRRP